jgi:hypothetical protein
MIDAARSRKSCLVLVVATLSCVEGAFAAGTVEGRILGFHSEPLAGVQIWIEREGHSIGDYRTRTRPDGRFTRKKIPGGRYYIAVVRIQPADDFTADHVDIRDGDLWEVDYSLHARTVTLVNRHRNVFRRYVYRGGTRSHLAGGRWEEIPQPSNKALQPTATRCAFTFFMTKSVLEICSRAPGSRG